MAVLQVIYQPPASNQLEQSVWPIAYVVLVQELSSGAALPAEIGAMYGDEAISETRLAQSLMKRLPPMSIVMADAGYGIFSSAYHAQLNGHKLIRLREFAARSAAASPIVRTRTMHH